MLTPIIEKEKLINDACDSFNNYIDSNPNYEGVWFGDEWYGVEYATPEDNKSRIALICMNYLRHEHTSYDTIWRTLRNAYFDEYEKFHYELKSKVNKAIRKAYPWINKEVSMTLY